MIDFLMIDRGFEYKWKMTFLGFILELLYSEMTLLISIKGVTYSNENEFFRNIFLKIARNEIGEELNCQYRMAFDNKFDSCNMAFAVT